mmetsp:Transcript_1518/g.6613  ORF Transcript_1518/g.6613 Transcript_1518/m.6613 type:complete len:368 (-) Transcript_1518:295-1398(-)
MVAMGVPIKRFQPVAQLVTARQGGNLLVHSRHCHVHCASIPGAIPVSKEQHIVCLLLCHEAACFLKVWLAFFPRGASRVSDHADVPQLVVPKEIPGVVVQGSPVFALIRINAEVQEASNRVLSIVLHHPNARLVVLIATVRRTAHPYIVVPRNGIQQLRLGFQTDSVKELLGNAAVLIVEVVAEDLEEMPAGVLRQRVEHLDGAAVGVPILSEQAGHPPLGEARIRPDDPRHRPIFLRQIHRNAMALHSVVVQTGLRINDAGVEPVLRQLGVRRLHRVIHLEVAAAGKLAKLLVRRPREVPAFFVGTACLEAGSFAVLRHPREHSGSAADTFASHVEGGLPAVLERRRVVHLEAHVLRGTVTDDGKP